MMGDLMEWLNYHHLCCFWTVMHEGSLTAASQRLRLAPSTVSAQLASLEEALAESSSIALVGAWSPPTWDVSCSVMPMTFFLSARR
jgi:hypothetical protein